MKNVVIACDHAGVELKNKIVNYLTSKNYMVVDVGTDSLDSVDYPDYAYKAVKYIISGETQCGILICGSGIGMSIAANRFKEIRAALCNNVELALLSRQHNDANMLVIGAKFVTNSQAIEIVDGFLSADFSEGRHLNRVAKLTKPKF